LIAAAEPVETPVGALAEAVGLAAPQVGDEAAGLAPGGVGAERGEPAVAVLTARGAAAVEQAGSRVVPAGLEAAGVCCRVVQVGFEAG
jgi:hypothetical protein